jgi:hypothetical protein
MGCEQRRKEERKCKKGDKGDGGDGEINQETLNLLYYPPISSRPLIPLALDFLSTLRVVAV